MHAIQQTRFGGPEVLELVELPDLVAGPGEVIVDVTLAGLNFADTHTRENKYVHQDDLPLIPGAEVAGVRRDTGERVVALCQRGGYASQVSVEEKRLAPIPDDLSDGAALALQIQGLTAWHLHRTAGRVAPGESVVIHSGAGGVGSLAVQLARPLAQAGRVIATASSPERQAAALEFGADVAIEGTADDLTARLIEANEGREVDVVFDMAGGAVFDASLRSLAPFGRIVVCGISSKEPNEVRTGHLLKNSRTVAGFWLFHCLNDPERLLRAPLVDLFDRAARGEVTPVIGGTWPLEQAAEAQQALSSRSTTGKLLLDLRS
ncbi:MAG: NADPH:quinone oxidoreductase family protein [Solirubrobacteraceae bacterium]|nr:NADPH:quinone oxidoreductase family protein [Solirubrobacteraceae bacterium]